MDYSYFQTGIRYMCIPFPYLSKLYPAPHTALLEVIEVYVTFSISLFLNIRCRIRRHSSARLRSSVPLQRGSFAGVSYAFVPVLFASFRLIQRRPVLSWKICRKKGGLRRQAVHKTPCVLYLSHCIPAVTLLGSTVIGGSP